VSANTRAYLGDEQAVGLGLFYKVTVGRRPLAQTLDAHVTRMNHIHSGVEGLELA
jgi:hypothetical protein